MTKAQAKAVLMIFLIVPSVAHFLRPFFRDVDEVDYTIATTVALLFFAIVLSFPLGITVSLWRSFRAWRARRRLARSMPKARAHYREDTP